MTVQMEEAHVILRAAEKCERRKVLKSIERVIEHYNEMHSKLGLNSIPPLSAKQCVVIEYVSRR